MIDLFFYILEHLTYIFKPTDNTINPVNKIITMESKSNAQRGRSLQLDCNLYYAGIISVWVRKILLFHSIWPTITKIVVLKNRGRVVWVIPVTYLIMMEYEIDRYHNWIVTNNRKIPLSQIVFTFNKSHKSPLRLTSIIIIIIIYSSLSNDLSSSACHQIIILPSVSVPILIL